MYIDSHQYFWESSNSRLEKLSHKNLDSLKKDHLPHDSLVNLVNNSFSSCIATAHISSEEENQYLLDLAHKNEIIAGVIAWIDLTSLTVGQKINAYNPLNVLGFRDSFLRHDSAHYPMSKEVIRGLVLISEYKYPFEVEASPKQFPAVVNLLYLRSRQTFVLNNMGYWPRSSQYLPAWKTMMKALSDLPNVYVKLNGWYKFKLETDLNTADIEEMIGFVIEHFGIKRILYGSDWPYSNLDSSFKEQFKFVHDIVAQHSDEALSFIFQKNIEKVYIKK
ncbi:amidohydrolase family protein [Membranihabitans marinus]|uniref:amidohydrolase family protein n=1 Tax=Membranihabitans marinus TaxID=1227546 RepID=UPI001F3E47B0|nr:amidohydrolase family protein [Membranihabitans marinus]